MDNDRDLHWTWLVAGAVVVLVLVPRPTRKSIRSLVHRCRAAIGVWLIDAGAHVIPDPPPDDPAVDELREAEFVAAMQRERTRGRRNGRHGPARKVL